MAQAAENATDRNCNRLAVDVSDQLTFNYLVADASPRLPMAFARCIDEPFAPDSFKRARLAAQWRRHPAANNLAQPVAPSCLAIVARLRIRASTTLGGRRRGAGTADDNKDDCAAAHLSDRIALKAFKGRLRKVVPGARPRIGGA